MPGLTDADGYSRGQNLIAKRPGTFWTTRVGIALGCLVCLALAFELTARIEDWIRYGMPIMSPFSAEADLVVHDSLGMHGRPGAHYLKWSMNSLGMRGPEAPRLPSPGTLRVITAGASETFGQSEAPGHEYPRQLEDTLQGRLAAAPGMSPFRHAEVLNAAFFGMSLPTAIQDVRLRLAGLQPDVIVLYPTATQYLADAIPVAASPLPGTPAGPGPWAPLRPRAWTRLREKVKSVVPREWRQKLWQRRIDRARAREGPLWSFDDAPTERLAAFDHDLRTFVGEVRAAGAEPVLVTHANRFAGVPNPDEGALAGWQQFYPRATGNAILEFDSAGAAITRRVAADSAVSLADVRSALRECSTCFVDHVHFTDRGAALVAGVIAPAVLEVARPR